MSHGCTPDIVAQIERHYRAGRTVTEIQRLVGKRPHTIRLVLAERGLLK